MKKAWKLDETTFLIDNWGTLTLADIMAALDRTEDSILRKARRIGIDLRKEEEDKLKRNWTKEEDQIIKDIYGVVPVADMLDCLEGRTAAAIRKRAGTLGVAASMKRWTKEDEEYLKDNWGMLSLRTMAKRLERTIASVHLKAYNYLNLKEQVKANGAYLTITDVCEIVGVNIRTLYSWIWERKLPVKTLKVGKSRKYQVSPKYLCKFLKKNQNKWDSRKADVATLKSYTSTYKAGKDDTLIIRNEQWLVDKVARDLKEGFTPVLRPWTTKEVERLIALKKQNKTYAVISLELNRDIESLKSKYYTLNKL